MDLKAVAICVHIAFTSTAIVAADEAEAGNVIHWPSASWCVFTKTYMPSSTAHFAVCTTLAIQAASIVYAGPAPRCFVQVTGSLSVLNPAACTALINV